MIIPVGVDSSALEISTQFQALANATLRVSWKGALNVIHANTSRRIRTLQKQSVDKYLHELKVQKECFYFRPAIVKYKYKK